MDNASEEGKRANGENSEVSVWGQCERRACAKMECLRRVGDEAVKAEGWMGIALYGAQLRVADVMRVKRRVGSLVVRTADGDGKRR